MADGPAIVYYGTRFDHAAVAARPIVGTIRDKDSGLPIAGVRITGMPNIPSSMVPTPGVEATSDAQGRYEVRGLSPTLGFKLFTEAPAGQPYVNCGFISPKAEPGPGPFVFDLALKRGVLVRGRLTNKVTGEALRGAVCYYAFADNPHLGDYPNFKRNSQITRVMIPGSDGRFAIPAFPGRGLISARAPEEGYLHGQGAGAIKGYLKEMRAFASKRPLNPFVHQRSRVSASLPWGRAGSLVSGSAMKRSRRGAKPGELGGVVPSRNGRFTQFPLLLRLEVPRQERLDVTRHLAPGFRARSKYHVSHRRGLSSHSDSVAKIENTAAASRPLHSAPDP